MNARITAAILTLLLMFTAACSSEDSAPDSNDGSTAITMALSSTGFAQVLLFYAQDAGIFAEHGLEVDFVIANSGADSMATLLSGDVEMAGTGITEAAVAHAQGRGVQLLATAFDGPAPSVVLSPEIAAGLPVTPDADPLERARALDGLRLATPSAASSYTQALDIMAGQAEFSYIPVYLTQAEMPAALNAGVIDGFLAAAPIPTTAVAGGAVLWLSGPLGQFPGANREQFIGYSVVANQDWIEQNSEASANYLEALVQAGDQINSDPNAARDLLRSRYSDVDENVYHAAWEENWRAWTQPLPTMEAVRRCIDTLPDSADFPANIRDIDINNFVPWNLVDPLR